MRTKWRPPGPSSRRSAQIEPAADWRPGGGDYEDIRYEIAEGIAKITIDRPEVRNAFRPETLIEVSEALDRAREDTDGRRDRPHRRGPARVLLGRRPARARRHRLRRRAARSVGRFHVTDLQVQMRRTPKPIVAMVAGYAIGGGHVLHVVCDLTIAADNARFGQTGPQRRQLRRRLRRQPARRPGGPEEGQGDLVPVPPVRRRARRSTMGLVNTVVPLEELEDGDGRAGAARCSSCRPFALRLLKASFNAAEDGLAGIQQLAHDANLLFYASEEAQEGRDAYREKRRPDFGKFPKRP